jgi:ATP-dependent DNA helicase RecG
MLIQLVAEATECDFKEALETKKPKSWLKSVSAFANGIGGTLFFGVANETSVIGLEHIQEAAEFISETVKARIVPLPNIILVPQRQDEKDFLALIVKPGRATPYYYSADGVRQAYIRLGNQSVPAPEHILHELILRGTNQTYDAVPTSLRKDDYSFTLLEATYLQRTKLRFEATDYLSFGLATETGFLTRAGSLLTDQHIVYNSRIFCTHWNGLEKGSVFEDAIDDKEYEGNLIYLLQNAGDFIRNNSQVRFAKAATERIDKPDYAERAVTEILVNSLIHRDYLAMGSEIHVDMFDDRMEISSPGGMFGGIPVQNQPIDQIKSDRRNPVIADLFHRMKYMERRGSGLRKILNETSKLPGYTDAMKPVFYSTPTSFTAILKNINYKTQKSNQQANQQVNQQVNQQANQQVNISKAILEFCEIPKSKKEIAAHMGFKDLRHFSSRYLKPLIDSGSLRMTIPSSPRHRNQKYITDYDTKAGD